VSEANNIAVVTIEWSDDYTGGDLTGHFGGEGNERYNFLPYRGDYYGYFPPNGHSFPTPKGGERWLVFFVSRPTDTDPAVVVGWYENATIVGDTPRPDANKLGLNFSEGEYSYSAVAKSVVAVPVAARECVLPKGDSLRSFAYVRVNGENRHNRIDLIKHLLNYRNRLPPPQATKIPTNTNGFPVDPVLREKVEKAAIKAVKADYGKGYKFKDFQKTMGAGYDLQFTDKETSEVWCIEVKGTAGSREAFFITRSEVRAGRAILEEEREGGSRRWRLALVTDALDPAKRELVYFDAEQLEVRFELQCLQWQAFPKSEIEE
jgi:hypothetical protein